MLKVTTYVPEMRPRYTNERETITAMTTRFLIRLKTRTIAGRGVDGPLPAPKDGGQAYNRTGTLVSGIAHVVAWKPRAGAQRATFGPLAVSDGTWTGVVRAFGDRPANEHGTTERAQYSARRRQAEARAGAAVGGFLSSLGSPVPGLRRPRLSRIRVRTVSTNAALAAVLSVRPRDLRASNGGRAEYRVFEANDGEHEEMGEIARSMLVVELVEVDGGRAGA
jgi:hypothetical protein